MKTIYISFLALLLFSCSLKNQPEPTCTDYLSAPIETVVAKENADASKFLFDVAFRVTDGCGNFGSFAETTEGNETTIEVIAKYEGCFCTEDTPLRETVYVFNENTPGTYTLKFKMSDDNYVTQMVTIE